MLRGKLICLLFLTLFVTISKAQVVHTNSDSGQKENLFIVPRFKPFVNIFIGYCYPNVDQNYLPRYEKMYHGHVSQTGPLMAALDYQFNQKTSIGLVATLGNVSASYYDSATMVKKFTTRLNNWSCMFDLVRYIPVNQKVFPYIRTAIGINSWNQDYTTIDGSKAPVTPVILPRLAYQAGIGAKFIVSGKVAVFIEGGYGKYVFDSGLSVKL